MESFESAIVSWMIMFGFFGLALWRLNKNRSQRLKRERQEAVLTRFR